MTREDDLRPKKKERYKNLGDWVCKNCTEENDAEDIKCFKCSTVRCFYIINVELQMCSCPSYKYSGGPCKHLLKHKKACMR